MLIPVDDVRQVDAQSTIERIEAASAGTAESAAGVASRLFQPDFDVLFDDEDPNVATVVQKQTAPAPELKDKANPA